MAIRQRILITGNGFDIHHELPTKYLQFIKVLINIERIEEKINTNVNIEELFEGIDGYESIKKKI